MNVLIIGAGEVGFHIADRLVREGHQVTVIDKDAEHAERVDDRINALVIKGNGASAKTLEEAGIKKTDLFIGVTDIDEVNLVSCLLAKEFNVPFKIARVKNIEYVGEQNALKTESLGIDLLINPQQVVARELCKIVSYPEATEVAEFENGKVIFISLKIGSHSPALNIPLKELRVSVKDSSFVVPAIFRKGKSFVPTGDDSIIEGDTVSFVCKREDLSKLYDILGMRRRSARNVMILGGGQLGYQVAENLTDGFHKIKIIEKNADRCQEISDKLEGVMILNTDNTDVQTLRDEGADHMDAYIAVTNDDGANILGSLLAKQNGVRRSIALVNNPELVTLAPSLGLDACVSPRLATASAVLSYIRGDRVMDMAMLEQDDAEVIEFRIAEDFPDVEKQIQDIKFPKGMILGAISRNDEVIIPTGQTMIHSGDNVIVFCLGMMIKKTEKFFSRS